MNKLVYIHNYLIYKCHVCDFIFMQAIASDLKKNILLFYDINYWFI